MKHPPSIINKIASMISKQVSDITCNSEKVVPDYYNALKKSDFNEKIKYSPSQPKQ